MFETFSNSLTCSDPFHERYGDHLSQADVNELIAPHPDTVDQVEQWLASYGISDEAISRSSARDWIRIKVPVSLAEEMLDTVSRVFIGSCASSGF